jgi:cation/acetate symporter
MHWRDVEEQAPTGRRVILSKFTLLAVALVAAVLASFKPAEILPLVTASFSLAASALVPVMVLGIFWAGATRAGAVAGMLGGLGIALYYMLANAPAVRVFLGLDPDHALWFGIQPLLAGVFGVPTGFAAAVAVSLSARLRRSALPRHA